MEPLPASARVPPGPPRPPAPPTTDQFPRPSSGPSPWGGARRTPWHRVLAEALHQLRLVVWPGRQWVLRVSVIVLTALVVVMAVILVVDVSTRVAVEELVGRR